MRLFHSIRICGLIILFLFYFLFLPSLFYKVGHLRRLFYKISGLFTRSKIQWCKPLKFRYSPGPLVALVSYPGSGDTWLRYLVQHSTGIYTGSIYNDQDLKRNGFPAEHIIDDTVIFVKTHWQWQKHKRSTLFTHAVLLVRSPEHAALAEFNWRSGGHLGSARPEKYLINQGKDWKNFVQHAEKDWSNLYMDWSKNFPGPKYVIFYENLVTNLEKELRALHRFLNVTVSERDLMCTMSRKEGFYRRHKIFVPFDPFTPVMRESLKREQTLVYQTLACNISNISPPPPLIA